MKYFNIAPTASEQAINLHNQKAAAKQAAGQDNEFATIMSVKVQKALESVRASEGQSLNAYKDEIYQRISEITVHPTQRDTGYAVHISEAGFRRMQRDPDYEQFVMDKIAEYMGTPYDTAADAPTFVMLYFDDTEDEHTAYLQGIDQEYTYEENKYGESFWDSRARRHEENMEASERLAAKRREQNEYFERKHLAEESLKEEMLARADARRKGEPYTDTKKRVILGTPASSAAAIMSDE